MKNYVITILELKNKEAHKMAKNNKDNKIFVRIMAGILAGFMVLGSMITVIYCIFGA